MRIFKSLLAGVVLAIFAAVLGTFVELAVMFWRLSSQLQASGGGGLGAVGGDMYFPLYALAGFAAGAWWYHRWSGRKELAATVAAPPGL